MEAMRIEHYFGESLFDRSSSGLEPTPSALKSWRRLGTSSLGWMPWGRGARVGRRKRAGF